LAPTSGAAGTGVCADARVARVATAAPGTTSAALTALPRFRNDLLFIVIVLWHQPSGPVVMRNLHPADRVNGNADSLVRVSR
jgi:hypothetical protein